LVALCCAFNIQRIEPYPELNHLEAGMSTSTPPPDSIDNSALPSAVDNTWEKKTLFSFGTALFLILLAIALFDRKPTQTSWYVYTCVLAMAAGGIAAVL